MYVGKNCASKKMLVLTVSFQKYHQGHQTFLPHAEVEFCFVLTYSIYMSIATYMAMSLKGNNFN